MQRFPQPLWPVTTIQRGMTQFMRLLVCYSNIVTDAQWVCKSVGSLFLLTIKVLVEFETRGECRFARLHVQSAVPTSGIWMHA